MSSTSTMTAASEPLPTTVWWLECKWRAPLHIYIATIFIMLFLVSSGIIGWFNYIKSRNMILSASDELFASLGREATLQFEDIYQPAEMLVDLLAHQRLGQDASLSERMVSTPFLADALRQSTVSAIYAGYPNGDFFLFRRIPTDAALRSSLHASDGAAYMIQSIERTGDNTRSMYLYLDSQLQEITRRDAQDYKYDPRTSNWYQRAAGGQVQIKTKPYPFFTTHEIGTTFARQSAIGPAVIGVDTTLQLLSRALQNQRVTPSSELVVYLRASGMVLAYSGSQRVIEAQAADSSSRLARLDELGAPIMASMMKEVLTQTVRDKYLLQVNGRVWRVFDQALSVRGERKGDIRLAIVAPQDELLANAYLIQRNAFFGTITIFLLCIPMVWLLSRVVSGPLRLLRNEARAIQEFDFTTPHTSVRSVVSEIDALAGTMDSMKVTIRKFLDISRTIAAERDFDHLLEHVLAETITAAGATAGVIYLLNADETVLTPAAARVQSDAITAAAISMTDNTLSRHPVRRALADDATIVVQLNPVDSEGQQLFGEFSKALSTMPQNVIVVPLRNRSSETLGAMCIFTGDSGELPRSLTSFITALSGTAEISIETQMLLRAQKDLFDSVTKLIASAIDAKSPYTGGHCQRVPELTKMLAEAACAATDGPFREFAMGEEEREALHIASWLHDCGKVTTPEYVVDKATKLETIYDRIHEVRMRFEVIKRDAEIEYWRNVSNGADRDTLQEHLKETWKALDDDFAFIANCNEGGEFISQDKVKRIHQIAQRTWMRTLDDRIGLSHEERSQKERLVAPVLPVTEQLLADKREHIIERASSDLMPADNPWGFKLTIPANKLNRGEIYNLCIGRGTLTEEERYIINNHIVQTIIMLSQLPFPKHLKQVPEIAGGHHEKMDGTGYPKRIKRDQMSIMARMMAIADIFEALTAVDRPYKKGKTLSEAIRIMDFMRKEQHIDSDIFELFLDTGVFRTYAQRFLLPSQVDEVDVKNPTAKAGGL
ncbi:HAMP domain-containing protein [Gammaproteobacteria bacterium]